MRRAFLPPLATAVNAFPYGVAYGTATVAPEAAGARRPRPEQPPMISLQAGPLHLDLTPAGCLHSLRTGDTERLPPGAARPLLTISLRGRAQHPTHAAHDPGAHRLTLAYGPGVEVDIRVTPHPTHLALTVCAIRGAEVTALLWGPFPTTLGDTVGETVGVVAGDAIALGLQACNPETVGGWPEAHAPLGCPDEAGRTGARYPYSECAAWRTAWGSVLQAYSRDPLGDDPARQTTPADRPLPVLTGSACSRDPLRDDSARQAAPADRPLRDLTGSSIALFACPPSAVLATIGAIEQAEGLPHPRLEGTWAKTSPAATSPYLITGFSEANLDGVLRYAKAAGLRYLYHPDPFESWGHYALKRTDFPDGDDSLRRCVQRAAAHRIGLGVHTLSNFLNTHDPYVTPRPDPRLQQTGGSLLAADVGAAAAEVPVLDPTPFREQGWLSTAVIGEELVRYAAVSPEAPWRLLDCERGAFGTAPTAHPGGAPVAKLADHGYRVFFPDIALQGEIADRLAELFARTGLRQISFDGLEGCLESGYGPYAEARFVARSAAHWPDGVINDASRLGHYAWHIHTRMNWGEPWGAAMREGQTEYRFANQDYFARNLFPAMLGWFLLRRASGQEEATTLDDIEWMLARAAAVDAGFALVADLATLEANGQTAAILEAVRRWESARRAGAFTAEQRGRLRGQGAEWHLAPDPDAEGAWRLWPLAISGVHTCRPGGLQPGQPAGADWPVHNPHGAQPLGFRLRAMGVVEDPAFRVGARPLVFRCRLTAGEYLLYEGGATATVCDADWNPLREPAATGAPLHLRPGLQTLSFSCASGGAAEARIITRGAPEGVAPPGLRL